MVVYEPNGRDEVVGAIGLYALRENARRAHAASIGMAVRDDWQGKGVGTVLLQEGVDLADKWLQIKRLELEVFVDNAPAIALYRRFGFEQEGLLRMFAFRDGAYVDVYTSVRIRWQVCSHSWMTSAVCSE